LPHNEGRGALVDDHVDRRQHGVGQGGEQIDAEGRVGPGAHGAHLLADPFGWLGRHAQRAVAAGLGDGRAELGVGDPAHAGEKNRHLDAEPFGELVSHAPSLRRRSSQS
jgi:hypothetical protein